MEPRRVRLHLWPGFYAIARLAAVPELPGDVTPGGPPVTLTVGHGEVSLIAPEALVDGLRVAIEEISRGWRALTLDVVLPHGTVGVLAAVGDALARIAVPVMVCSSHDTDHFLVPAAQLGRALAAINGIDLERFLPPQES